MGDQDIRAGNDGRSCFTFREAIAGDLPAIVNLLHDDELGQTREVVTDPPDAAYVAAFDAVTKDSNQFLVVAVRDRKRVVGCMQISFIPGLSHRGQWRGQIESVRVASSERGHGLGQLFFEWAIEECRARGCGMVQLTTNANRLDARRFYDRLGFQPTHIGYKLGL